MELSKAGQIELASYEAVILSPYLDSVNVKTVGIGSTKSDIPDLDSWSWTKTLTIDEALEYYQKGLKKYEAAVNKAINYKEIPQHQFDALVSVTYNIGTGGMAKSTFIKRFNENAQLELVGAAIKSWNKAGGKVLKGLVNRREKEVNLLINGIYSSGGKVLLVPVNESTHKPIYKLGKLIKIL